MYGDLSEQSQKQVVQVKEILEVVEQHLAELVSECQDIAEDQCDEQDWAYDDFTECYECEGKGGDCEFCQGTGERGIVYPENAASELDCARTLIQDALVEVNCFLPK